MAGAVAGRVAHTGRVAGAVAGQTDPDIAAAMGLSVWTVRKWRRRAQREGRPGLASCLGRPPTGALGHFPSEIREAVRQMRQAHPGWGPLTIRTELEGDPRFAGRKLPSRSRIAAFLKQEGLTRQYERHTELPQPQSEASQRPHEEWEMDTQGVIRIPHLGLVSLINIGDRVSRLMVDSFPCLETAKPTTLDYQLVLRRAFVRYGLPERLSLDHDSVFYDNTSASPYPTLLHLWLIAFGVEVRFGRKGRPTDHGFIERTHQTITRQAIAGQEFADGSALQETLDDRLDFLNRRFPSRSLDGQPPLEVYPEAWQSSRPYRPEWEEALLDLQRVYDYLAQGRWFRRTTPQGQFSLGGHRYGVGKDFASQTLEITFDPQTRQFVCLSEDSQQTIRLSAQGLTKAKLMGELEPLIALPFYQLALPFSLDAWREVILCNELTGTTL
jgi:transposase InsO family protein